MRTVPIEEDTPKENTHAQQAELENNVKVQPKQRDSFFNIQQRLKNNKLWQFFCTDQEITIQSVDSIMNTIALLNGLLITIPFGLVGNLGYQFWDWLAETLRTCTYFTSEFTAQDAYGQFYRNCYNAYNGCVYSTLTALIIVVLYYVFRPDEEVAFQKFLRRNMWTILLSLALTLAAVVSLLVLNGYVAQQYFTSTYHYCHNQRFNGGATTTGVAIFGVVFVAVVVSMI